MNGQTLSQYEHSCVVNVQPRLHVTLIGMGENGYRMNGGVGLSICEPQATITAELSETFIIEDQRVIGFSESELVRIKNKIAKINRKTTDNVSIKITGRMPSHCGLGSSTAIRLACLEACMKLWQVPYTKENLILQSGRGGTSGVGVQTYFAGGLVFDLGVQDRRKHNPSSQREKKTKLPLLLLHCALPTWSIGLCLPKTMKGLSGEEEKQFFERTCPISQSGVHEILYAVTYGLAAAILESNYQSFCTAIKHIQSTEWKRAERNIYGRELLELENYIYENGADCVGLSSIGPCLFYFAKDVTSITNLMQNTRDDCIWIATSLNNSARVFHV